MERSWSRSGAGRRLGVCSIAAVIAATSLVLTVSPRVVFASCNPGRTPSHVTHMAGTALRPSTTATGIRAAILEYSPYVETNSTSTAWVMLTYNEVYYAQAGWWRRYLSPGNFARKVFTQWYLPGHPMITTEWTAHTLGTSTTYKVIYSVALHRYEMWDGDYERDFEPSTTAPNEDQVFGETQNYNDQMPGGTGAHVTFTSTLEQHSGSTTWYNVTAPVQALAPYGGSRPSSGRYEIWDTGCLQ